MEEGDDPKATGKVLRAPIPFPSSHYHFHDSSDARVVQGGVEINDLGQERRKMGCFRASSSRCRQSNACCAGTLSGTTRTSIKDSRQKLMANHF